MRDLSRHGAEIERGLPGVWRGPRDGARDRLLYAADAYPQRPDAPHAQPRIRQRLCLRPRHRGRLLGPELFPEGVARRNFYRPGERGFEREINKRLEYWEKLRQGTAATAQ